MWRWLKAFASIIAIHLGLGIWFITKISDRNCCSLFQWFYCKEGDGSNVITFFYGGGGVVKKAMATSYHLFSFLFFGIFNIVR
jgi:hypothetical protein